MKKIISCILSLLILVICFSSVGLTDISAVNTEENSSVETVSKKSQITDDFNIVSENEKFALYYRGTDANIALLNKATGYVWYSNPQKLDDFSSGTRIKSQIAFQYYDNGAANTMDNYEFGISNQNLPEFSVQDNVLTVSYKVGDTAFVTEMLPSAIIKESMEKNILSKLDETEQASILERFSFYSAENMDADTYKVIEMNFPSIKEHDLYVFNSATPSYIAKGIYDLFVKAGYSVDQLDKYCEESGVENRYEEKPFFNADVQFSLTDKGMTVSLDPAKIQFSTNFKPINVQLLPYFGATYKDCEGYMLVPDGSGAVIEMNNGKSAVSAYEKLVYEVDNIKNAETTSGNLQLTSLPFFGLASKNGSFVASIDSGYEVAGISAEVSGMSTSFNKVSPYFTLFTSDVVSFSSNKLDTYIEDSENIFSDKITINYLFSDGYDTYSELAINYKEHLKSTGILNDNEISSKDMNLSFIGAVEVTKNFLGIPYKAMDSYTKLEDVNTILSKLSINNVDVRLTDFMAGGSNQKNVSSLKLQGCVGKIKKVSELYDKTNTTYLSLYSQYQSKAAKSKSAISVSKEVAYKLNYSLITGKKETAKYSFLLSPVLLEKYSEKIADQINKNNIEAVNLRDIGYELNSDLRENAEVDRHGTRVKIQKYLSNLSKVAKISVDKGSVFSLPYINKIWDIPMDTSNYHIEDYSVPFYQMVISGNVSYVAPAINESSDHTNEFLKCIEYGAEPQFTLTYNDIDNVNYYKEDYYSYNYGNYIEIIKEFADKYGELSTAINGSSMISHNNSDGETAVVEYENGVKVYINYSDSVKKVDGNEIQANDFLILK